MAPSKRASFAMTLHKSRAILFGGTADEEGKGGEVLVSNFFNDLYQLNLTQWRWYPVAMRSQKPGAGAWTFLCFQFRLCRLMLGTCSFEVFKLLES